MATSSPVSIPKPSLAPPNAAGTGPQAPGTAKAQPEAEEQLLLPVCNSTTALLLGQQGPSRAQQAVNPSSTPDVVPNPSREDSCCSLTLRTISPLPPRVLPSDHKGRISSAFLSAPPLTEQSLLPKSLARGWLMFLETGMHFMPFLLWPYLLIS